MIFYFSGIYPAKCKVFPDDPEMNTFQDGDIDYNRMVCPVYEREAEYIYRNIRRAKKYANKQNATTDKPGQSQKRGRRKR